MSLNIGFIGNFSVDYSTESDRKWSFEHLGHKVYPFQENEVTANDLLVSLDDLDLLLYSHTHGWEIPGLEGVFRKCKSAGIPTASAHLDRWAWLEREKDVGQEATWHTEYIFMADASPEAVELYDKHHLNWHWLKPGVVERDCKMWDVAKIDGETIYKGYDVIFVGSKGYHPEYPFRPQLIDFLAKTYGERFGHFGNDGLGVVRGDALNQLYASAKVVVGDSCFGGRPRYWSDRITETTGRGGFLLHPIVEGQDNRFVMGYDGLDDLKERVDYYLANPKERRKLQNQAHNWTKKHATYTHRSQEMLKTMNLA